MSLTLGVGGSFDSARHLVQEVSMATDIQELQTEDFIEQRVRYSIDLGDRLVIVENVPARVSRRTGEQLFSPETTERLWSIVRGGGPPARMVEVPVYEYR